MAWIKPFFGLFFASTAVIPGGDGGAGAGGDAGDVGDAGAGGGEEVVDTEATVEAGEVADAEIDTGEADRAPKIITEKDVSKSLEELKKTNPRIAGELRKAYYDSKRFREFFPNPAAAQQAHELLETVGGEEGIGSMQGEVQEYAEELTGMAQGDPKLIDELATDFPDGLAKLTPVALDKLQSVNPAAYDRTMARHMARIFRDKNVTNVVRRALELTQDGKGQQVFDTLTRLQQWMAGIEDLASKEPETRGADDPQRKEIESEREAVNKEKATIFTTKVANAVTASMNKIIERHLAPLMKGRKLSLEQRQELASGTSSRIANALKADKVYQRRLKALLEQGDVAKIDRFVSSHVEQRAAVAARAKWNASGFSGTKAAAAGNGNGQRPRVIAGKKPNSADIDWTKDPTRTRFASGEATLKNGSVAKWDWDAV